MQRTIKQQQIDRAISGANATSFTITSTTTATMRGIHKQITRSLCFQQLSDTCCCDLLRKRATGVAGNCCRWWMNGNKQTHTHYQRVSLNVKSHLICNADRCSVIGDFLFPAHNISIYIFIVYNYLSYSSETLMQQASAHKTEATPAKAVVATTNDRQGDIECLAIACCFCKTLWSALLLRVFRVRWSAT